MGAHRIAIDASGDLALLGGSEGTAGVYSLSQAKLSEEIKLGDPVTDTLWAGSSAIAATSTGSINIIQDGEIKSTVQGHHGGITSLALHPSEEILASVGIDKAYVLYDLNTETKVVQLDTDSGKLSLWSGTEKTAVLT